MNARVPSPCLWCKEPILPGDLRHSLMDGYHYACAVRAALGPIAHLQKRCSCFVKDGSAEHEPPGISMRQAARLVADYVNQRPGSN